MAIETQLSNDPAVQRSDPVRHLAAVTPSDGTDLTWTTRAIYVGGSGNLVVITAEGETVTLNGCQAGSWHPIAVARIKATNTTATNIVAAW